LRLVAQALPRAVPTPRPGVLPGAVRGRRGHAVGPPRSQRHAAPRGAVVTAARRPKASVGTWSVNHNPFGRAHVLAELLADEFEVELVGFDFPAHGRGVWEPLRDTVFPVRSFGGTAFPAHHDLLQAVGTTIDADVIVVSKPRLSAIAVAAFAKQAAAR